MQHHAPGDGRRREAGIGRRPPGAAGDSQEKPNGVRQIVSDRAVAAATAQSGIRHARRIRAPSRARRVARQRRRLQEAGAELSERSGEQLLHQQERDEVEQQRRQHFMHAPPQMDRGRQRRPRARPARRRPRARRRRREGTKTAGQCNATAAAPTPPSAICPSAPMLMTPARKQSATPLPASR